MSDFMVKTDRLNQVAGQLSSASRRIDQIADDAKSIILNTRSSLSTKLVEYAKATLIHSSVENSASDLKNLANALNNSASIYEKYEKKLMGITTTDKGSGKNDISFDFGKLIQDIIKKCGVFGMAYAAGDTLGKAISGGKWTDLFKGINDVYDTFKKNHKIFKDIKRYSNLKPSNGQLISTWAKKLFGFENYAKTMGFKPSQASNLSTKWYNNFQKVKQAELDDAFGDTAGKIGVAVSALMNGISNYEEYKSGSISGGRAVAETVVETGVDIAVSTGLSIALGTVAATAGAPAIAVAAGVVVINAGLNFATEKLTGGKYDSFTELASDTIIDVADGFIDASVNCFKKAAGGISAGWKKLFG